MYRAQILLTNNSVDGLLEELRKVPSNYNIMIAHFDSLYVIDIDSCYLKDNALHLSSYDNRGQNSHLAVSELLTYLEEHSDVNGIVLDAATELDPDLDCQMDEEQEIAGLQINNVCQDVYIVSNCGA